MELNVQVEKPSKLTRKLTIRVPAKTVTQRIEQGLVQVQRTANLKGFRPGHVPLPVIKQVYGKDVEHRVFHNLIDESYREALRQEKILAVGSPKIEADEHKSGEGAHDHGIEEGKDLTFTATVEVLPEIEPKGYTGVSLTEEQVEVAKEEVERVVGQLHDSQAQLVPATSGLVGATGEKSSRPVRKGDFVDTQFSGGIVTDKGVEERPGMKGQRVIEIGSNSLIQGFEENLIDMRAGETKTFRVTFPKDYFEEDLREKEAEFTVTVNDVKEKKLPELDDEFAKQMGYEGLADLRKKAEEHLLREKTRDSERKLRSDLLKALIDKNPFDCPQALIQAQTRALAQEVAENLKQQGFNDQMIQEAVTSELGNLSKRAENQVRASLIVEAIAKKEDISVAAEEVENEIKTMAASVKMDEQQVRDFYEKTPGRKEDLEFRIREDKTIKFLLDKAKIKKAKSS